MHLPFQKEKGCLTEPSVWNVVCCYSPRKVRSDGHRPDGVVMTRPVDLAVLQYAVLEAFRTEGPPERFVIAYPNEESLRSLIARRNIIRCGFASRDEAQAHLNARSANFGRGTIAWKWIRRLYIDSVNVILPSLHVVNSRGNLAGSKS